MTPRVIGPAPRRTQVRPGKEGTRMSLCLGADPSRSAAARRWWVLATVAAGQFMLVVDAFIVNVAIPSIRTALDASGAEIEAVIAVYQIAFATLLVTGGRLGDIHGRKPVFLCGLLGFTLSSLWCGLAQTGMELVMARLAQGACAALVSPQVLATIHALFPDHQARAKAFGLYGIALGMGGGVGYALGGWLVALDLGGLGWRTVFLVNLPVGGMLAGVAWKLMPGGGERPEVRLDLAGAGLLFASLMCVLVPILVARDWGWPVWLLAVELSGAAGLVAFLRLQGAIERRGGAPLMDPGLLRDRGFRLGLGAMALLFLGNLSFYLVVTLFLQGGLGLAPFAAGLTMLPLIAAFIAGSRRGAGKVARRGAAALARGAMVMCLGIAACLGLIAAQRSPAPWAMALTFALFGYGQGAVMASLMGVALASVGQANAGTGSGVLATTQQIANGVGVAVLGAVYFTVQAAYSDRGAVLSALGVLGAIGVGTTLVLRRLSCRQ
ncbi:MAG TPA: MFS transporter [Acetobacteraceae bacterium]|nr:MFS transporter [Acetobacteraceae bacterium]